MVRNHCQDLLCAIFYVLEKDDDDPMEWQSFIVTKMVAGFYVIAELYKT